MSEWFSCWFISDISVRIVFDDTSRCFESSEPVMNPVWFWRKCRIFLWRRVRLSALIFLVLSACCCSGLSAVHLLHRLHCIRKYFLFKEEKVNLREAGICISIKE